jgi:hypothetical protein
VDADRPADLKVAEAAYGVLRIGELVDYVHIAGLL